MAEGAADRACLAKAAESLAGAEREFAAGADNNCANRAYYACFQTAIAALLSAGIGPSPGGDKWRHEAVHAQFTDRLINRRKRYPSQLRGTLEAGARLRARADYSDDDVPEIQAARGLRQARAFVAAVRERGGTTR